MAHPPIDLSGPWSGPTGTSSTDVDAARVASPSDLDVDPERTTKLPPTPPSPPLPHPLATTDPERIGLVARIPGNCMPPPVFTSGATVTPARSAAPSTRPPSDAPPPVFSAQHAPQPPRSHRPVVIAAIAGCVVLAVVLVVVASTRGGGPCSAASTPRDAVDGHLEALALGGSADASTDPPTITYR
jgi:hypothetical protein